MDDRKAFEAIVSVLRACIQWNALPRELGASSTVHNRFQEWERAGFFKTVWRAGMSEYDDLQGIQWEWQAMDGVMTKALQAGASSTSTELLQEVQEFAAPLGPSREGTERLLAPEIEPPFCPATRDYRQNPGANIARMICRYQLC